MKQKELIAAKTLSVLNSFNESSGEKKQRGEIGAKSESKMRTVYVNRFKVKEKEIKSKIQKLHKHYVHERRRLW